MVTIRDLLDLECLSDAQLLVAVENYQDVRIHDVAVMDVEPVLGSFDVFKPHEAVFTSLGFSNGDLDKVNQAIIGLLRQNVGAIFVKDVFDFAPSGEIEGIAARFDTPIFRYGKSYIEVIITEARTFISDAERNDKEFEAVEAVRCIRNAQSVSRALGGILEKEPAFMQVVAFAEKPGTRARMRTLTESAKEACNAVFGTPPTIRHYGDAVLAFVACTHDRLSPHAAKDMGVFLGKTDVRVGISESLPSSDADVAIEEALAALDVSIESNRSASAWQDLACRGFHAAAVSSPFMKRACATGRDKLRCFDAQKNGDLEKCMASYVACGGDVNKAAEATHQHPNSMRNRLASARSVLSCEDMGDKEFFAYLTLIYL